MNGNHAFLVAGFGLIVLGVLAMVGCSTGCTIHVPDDWTSVSSKDGVDLPHKATLHLSSAERPARIVLDLESAAISVVGDASVTGLEADYEVREKTPGDASLAASSDGVLVGSAGGNPVLVTSAKLRVPPGTPVDVSTSLGAVSVSGIHGAASVVAKTDSGRVTLSDLSDVPKVEGRTNLGEVTMTKGAGLAEVSLTTDSGAVSAHDVSGAKKVTLRSNLGAVTAASVAASETLTLETDCGAVEVSDVSTARARLHTDLGSVSARHSTFDHLYAHSDCGGIHLTACKSRTKDVGTDLGSVKEDE